jgi:uncharacterized membrane protein (DUF106 family)
METVPVTIAAISIPTGVIPALSSNSLPYPRLVVIVGICMIVLGIVAVFRANWLVYQKRKEETQNTFEEKLLRMKEIELLDKMLAKLEELTKNKGQKNE